VHAVLEGQFTLIAGNALHIRAVPGRKTDLSLRLNPDARYPPNSGNFNTSDKDRPDSSV
jgi:hypothetical protein